MAKKKKSTAKKDAEPPAKQKKAIVKPKEKPAAKKVTEKKASAATAKAITKKSIGKMENKDLPADANDKIIQPDAIQAQVISADALNPQIISAEKNIELNQRTDTTNKLTELISNKFVPMFSEVVKRQPAVTTAPATTETSAPPATEQPIEVITETNNTTKAPITNIKTSGGFSLPKINLDWKKFSTEPFGELTKLFRKETVEEEKPIGDREPMVIVADFTLPYRCCEDYVCEDLCYSDEELAMLPIPPFAKDDFAVTRKDTPVDIYPDMNDSHLFKDFIVVKEIEDGLSFTTPIGGTVTSDTKGERAHFIYTPPKGQSAISDSFVYTLYNTKNNLSDTAVIWIEVGAVPPTFSVKTNFCSNEKPEPIVVDPKGNDWNNIDVTGSGVVKSVNPSTQIPSWTFDPSQANIGTNQITLTLNSKTIDTIDVIVTQVKAGFDTVGTAQLNGLQRQGGSVFVKDLSSGGDTYMWEWSSKYGKDRQAISPDASGMIIFPFPELPVNWDDFTMEVKLILSAGESCIDVESHAVDIHFSKNF